MSDSRAQEGAAPANQHPTSRAWAGLSPSSCVTENFTAHDFLLPVPQAHVLAALRAVRIDAELFNPHDGAVGACWPSHLDLHRGEFPKAAAHAAAPGTQQGRRTTEGCPTLLKTFKARLRWRCSGKKGGDM